MSLSSKQPIVTAAGELQLAVSVVVRRNGRYLLVERANDPGRGMHAFPGGKVEPGENIEDAARRELSEETALIAVDLEPLAQVRIDGHRGGFILHVFEASDVTGDGVAGDDAASLGWYLPQDMDALSMPQSVRDVVAQLSGKQE